MTDGYRVEVRPRRARIVCSVVAVAVLAVFGTAAALLRSSATGVRFDVGDQVAVAGIGVLIATGTLLLARPRVRADTRVLLVRNLFTERVVPWGVVRGIRFPDRSPWASLDLLDDEALPLMAVRAADRDRAVAALDALRELLDRYGAGPTGRADPDGSAT